jgi:transposase
VLRFRLMVKRDHRWKGPKHQKESAAWTILLDWTYKDTSVCIVDGAGKIVWEVKVASEPDDLLQVLRNPAYCFKRIGLEAGPLSQWLFSALAEANLPVICVETRHMRAVLKAQINKTDRNDARGIAQMMRVGLYRPVHVKTLRSQKLRMLLTHRKLLQAKAIAVENDLRATLRNFGLKVGVVGTVKFEARIKELVENLPDLAGLVEPLLVVRRVLREQIAILHRRVLAVVRDDEVCRRLMTVPGVGPVVALTYRATVDVPARFCKSKSVGAVFGLTPAREQSGERDRPGAISRCGDEMMRTTLYEAAQILLVRSTRWSWLKAWAMKIARHRGMKKAIVALARRLAVIMHRIWTDGTEFRWTRQPAAA